MKPGSWSSILAVFLYGVLGASTISKLVPLAGDIALQFGTSPSQFGWLISLVGLTALFLAIPSGLVVDRYGSRRVLQACMLLGAMANAVYYFAPTFAVMQLARLLEGVAIVHMYTAAPAFLMTTNEGPRRGTAMAVWAAYMPAGTAVGLLLAGVFAGTAGWRMTFAFHGALFLLVGLINLRQPKVAPTFGGVVPTLAQRLPDLRGAYSRPALLLLALAFFLMISLGFGANTTFPGYFAVIHQVPISSTSNVIAFATLLMIPGSLLAGALIAAGVRQSVIFSVLGLVGVVVGSLSFHPGLSMAPRFIVVGTWFIVSGAALATLMATLPQVAEPQRRGAAAALLNQAGATATFVNPPLWLPLAAAGGWLPFAGLMLAGWTISVASVWGLSLFQSSRSAR
jgi:predicted MFS family arabinose efflux permease